MDSLVIYVLVFILGSAIGSFLNVVIYRIPLEKSIISPPSSCPKCGARIKPWHNIPILGWIILGGKCANCKEKISPRYPIIEAITGILAVIVYSKFNTFDIWFIMTFSVFATLLALTMIDFDYKAVPDSLNLLALTLAVFTSSNILENITNAFIMMGVISALRFYVSYFMKKEALGEGDIIVAGTMGALLGIKLSLMALFISALIAIFPSLYIKFKKNDLELPFIPFLTSATFIVWYFNDFFLTLWSKLYG